VSPDRLQTVVDGCEPELSALERKVRERVPDARSQPGIGEHDLGSERDLIAVGDDLGVVDADHEGTGGNGVRSFDRDQLMAGRLASLSSGASVSTLVELRAELMLQGRLR
jgi:hypothetical protein